MRDAPLPKPPPRARRLGICGHDVQTAALSSELFLDVELSLPGGRLRMREDVPFSLGLMSGVMGGVRYTTTF